MIKFENISKQLFLASFVLLSLTSMSAAKDFGAWEGFKGENYRYAEHYGKTSSGGTPMIQRFDFTYSRKHGWQFYVTTHLVPAVDPLRLLVNVGGKEFVFETVSPFGKQSWPADEAFLAAVKNSNEPIFVEEIYTGVDGLRYNAVINTEGLADALQWVGDVP